MPLISPSQIHAVLQAESGAPRGGHGGKLNLEKELELANLTPREVLENLASLMRSAESDSTRLRAAETSLKLNGLLDSDSARPDFSVTINIVDGDYTVNPILIPR